MDIRDEYKSGNFSLLSEELQNKLAEILDSRGQAILFINRKGTAGFIQCQDCGTAEKCPECDLPLVYHEQKEELACHHCGFTKENPLTCAYCDSPKIKYQSPGLDKLAKETQKLFPAAKIAAVDAKNVKTKKELVQLAQDISGKKIDILIGTQALTKLPDWLKFDLAGIVRADNILNIPEFNQSEKGWQLLSELTKYGKTVILQTHRPDNEAIKAIVNNEAEKFLEEELKNREKWGYPPFGQLVKLIYKETPRRGSGQAARGEESKKARGASTDAGERSGEKDAQTMADQLINIVKKNQYQDVEINGPLRPLLHKVRGKHIWYIIIKFKKPSEEVKKTLLSVVGKGWIIDIDPDSLL